MKRVFHKILSISLTGAFIIAVVALVALLGKGLAVEIVGVPAAAKVMVNNFVSLPVPLEAVTLKSKVPAAVDVPDITPVDELIEKLPGSLWSSDHVIGAVPVAVRVWL